MAASYLRKYATGTGSDIYINIPKAVSANHAVNADWTPAAGDVKISIDGGASANIGTLPTAVAMGNSAIWKFVFSNAELTGKFISVTVSDSATKAVDDTGFSIETYGNASAQYLVDFNDSVRFGLTALPNAAAEAAGGLYTRGSGAGQINQSANGQVDTNVARWLNTAVGAATAGVPNVNATHINNVATTSVTTVSANVGTTQPINFTGTGATAYVKTDMILNAGTAQTAADLGISIALVYNDTQAILDDTGTSGVVVATASRPGVRKNTALAAFEFMMTDSTNHAPATGLTVSATRSIDGGAFGAGTLSAVTEVSNGIYKVDFGAGDLNGNVVTLRATASGADDLFVTIKTSP